MKNTLLAVAITVATFGTAVGAGSGHPGFGCDNEAERMIDRLAARMTDGFNLAIGRQGRIHDIKGARHWIAQAQKSRSRERFLAVLSDEQRHRFLAYLDFPAQAVAEPSGDDIERFVDRKLARLSAVLDLSEMQAIEIADVLTQEAAQDRAARRLVSQLLAHAERS